eukprot:6181090-Pleurochrysis_carterae.AAC.4
MAALPCVMRAMHESVSLMMNGSFVGADSLSSTETACCASSIDWKGSKSCARSESAITATRWSRCRGSFCAEVSRKTASTSADKPCSKSSARFSDESCGAEAHRRGGASQQGQADERRGAPPLWEGKAL